MGKSLVLGFFDGVHKGHRAVIQSAFDFSDEVVVITFKDSPSLYFSGTAEYILSRRDSVEKMKSLGVKEVVELDFSKIAKIKAEEYLQELIEKYHPISISTGEDHTFGYNKEGNVELLKKYGNLYNYTQISVPAVLYDKTRVSSTLIKDYIKQGNVSYANKLLESNFTIEGTVVHGAKIGRSIGFPTANINYPENIVKLPFGVYQVKINFAQSIPPKELSTFVRTSVLNSISKAPSPLAGEGRGEGYSPAITTHVNGLSAIMNWGMKPTVNNTKEPIVEVHILNFDEDLYGKNIRIEVLNQIRGEKKFNNLEELKKQIQEDINKCSEL